MIARSSRRGLGTRAFGDSCTYYNVVSPNDENFNKPSNIGIHMYIVQMKIIQP